MTTNSTSSSVWLDMDQATLDRAYDQPQWAPNMADVLLDYAARSRRVRERIEPLRASYGPSHVEALDFFDCGRPGAPVHVFFHGGAWRSGKAQDYAFLAEVFLAAGVHLVLPDFDWVQDHGGDLRPIAEQARRVVAWLHANVQRLGGDPQRLFVSGHSSGAHLASVLATTDWPQRGLPADLVKGSLLCSGVYELEPVRRSSRRRYLSIDDAAVQALSPIRHLAHARGPMVVAWGTRESPEFERQGREFADAAESAGLAIQRLVVPDSNHFEVLDAFARADGVLARAALQLAKPSSLKPL
jgi:arylformamidase